MRSFLLTILPAGVEVLAGQDNRVAEPQEPDFVIFWPLHRRRLETNIDTGMDVIFVGSVAATVLTVATISQGVIAPGLSLFGPTVAAGSVIGAFITGSGGIGTYSISPTQTVASGPLAAGFEVVKEATEVTFQLDVHGPNSADNAQTISSLWRDDFAFQQFFTSGFDVVPLHADDPIQMPFLNAEQQYETRWVITAILQANQVVSFPQQFAGQLQLNPIPVGA